MPLERLADLRSLAFMVATPALMWWQWVNGPRLWAFLLLCVLGVGLAVVQHNHTHRRMWRWGWLNAATDLHLSLVQGVPTFVFRPAHIADHHRHNHGPEDTTRTYRWGGHHNTLLGYLLHPFFAFGSLLPSLLRHAGGQFRTGRLMPLTQVVAVLGLWTTLTALDARAFVFIALLPQLVAGHWLLGANYLQHAGCRPGAGPEAATDGTFQHARNFTGLMNLVWFNIGYHAAHHHRPGVHWADLPSLHAELSERIPDDLVHRSLTGYMLAMLLPSRRPWSMHGPTRVDWGIASGNEPLVGETGCELL
jgi:fatty acid desaturase